MLKKVKLMTSQNIKRCSNCQSVYPASDNACPSCSGATSLDSNYNDNSFSLELPSAGYVYALINPSMDGLVKIGKTTRHPDDRAKELSASSGVPTPFAVAYHKYFQDCAKAEEFVHSRLNTMNYKVTNNREFFNAPLRVAIDVILEAWNHYGLSFQDDVPNQIDKNKSIPFSANPWDYDLELAKAFHNGDGDTLQDYGKALSHYLKAAKLGSPEAHYQIGTMYEYGFGVEENQEKALSYFNEGAELGSADCYVSMADIYREIGHYHNSNKCWDLLFKNEGFRNEMDDFRRKEYFLNYLRSYGNLNNIPDEHISSLEPFKLELQKVARNCGRD